MAAEQGVTVMWAKIAISLVFSVVMPVSAAELVPDDLSQLRSRVVSECRERSAVSFSTCVSDAGLGVIATNELLKYNDTSLNSLCAQTASGRLLSYLECMRAQLQIKQLSPFAQYSSLILRTDQFRPAWVSSCRTENGLDVSDCVKKKTADFYRFWEIYTGLPKQHARLHSKFESCMSVQRNVEWAEFLSCYQH